MTGKRYILLFALSISLSGCLGPVPRFISKEVAPAGHLLNAAQVLEGIASYYANEFDGRLTANGEVYDMNGFSAAHRYLPFGTVVRVTNRTNQKSIVLRINDRGPFVDGREIDLSLGAAKELGFVEEGTCPVTIEVMDLRSQPN